MVRLDPTKCYREIRINKETEKVTKGPYRGKVIRQFTEGSGDGRMDYVDFSREKRVDYGDYSGLAWVEFEEVECEGNDVPPPGNNGTGHKHGHGNGHNRHHKGGRKTRKRKTKKSRKTRK